MRTPRHPVAPTDLASLARFIQSDDCQSILMLTGAGVSVAAGIPDFRSPTGMYAQLRPETITTSSTHELKLIQRNPAYVVSWDIFQHNQLPYLEVRRPFILGTLEQKWKATLAHRFAEFLHTKTHKLTRIYTQNIDGLEFQTSIPRDKIVNVHGSLSEIACEGCKYQVDLESFCQSLKANIRDIYGIDNEPPTVSRPILCPACQRPLLKPTTVLFGRSLPEEFFAKSAQDVSEADLLIIAGTSLVVSPANSLVYKVPDSTVRVVINREPVGEELGIDYSTNSSERTQRDFFAQGECDQIFLGLIKELGWLVDIQGMIDLLPEESARIVQESTGLN